MNKDTIMNLWAHRLWNSFHKRQGKQFRRSLNHPREVQERILLRLLAQNGKTVYGRAHALDRVTSVDLFSETVPLTDYEDYLSFVDRIAAGEDNVLTRAPVLLFEPSSGTSSASKHIPYTACLKEEFLRGITPWMLSLHTQYPKVMRGKSYWSISPPVARADQLGALPVGFDDDAEYLGPLGRRLHALTSAVPRSVIHAPDGDSFRKQTLIHLLAAENLAFISVWSPTFLIVLLDHVLGNVDEILEGLESSGLPGARTRARKLKPILKSSDAGEVFARSWPGLAAVSCWMHGSSRPYAEQLQEYLPHAGMQAKGLIATEAFVSLPFMARHDPVLAVESHFFEFRDSESGEMLLAHEVKQGRIYSVIVTTGGGFYRYRLHDTVEITGFIGQTPTLRFVSKEGQVSDSFGEKLHGDHVQRSVTTVLRQCAAACHFALLAPVHPKDGPAFYTLYLASENGVAGKAKKISEMLDLCLAENFHYAHCRKVGQLGAARVFLIDRTHGRPEQVYLQEHVRRGQKLGDIKPAVLDRETGWENRFDGRFVE